MYENWELSYLHREPESVVGSVTNCLNPFACKNCSMSVECDDDSKLLLNSPSRSVGTDSKGIFSKYKHRWATKEIVRSCGRL